MIASKLKSGDEVRVIAPPRNLTEDRFYEKCRYNKIFELNGQSIYQKVL